MSRAKKPAPASLFDWAGVKAPEPTPVVTPDEPVPVVVEPAPVIVATAPVVEPETPAITVVVPFPELPATLASRREGTTVAVVKDIRGEWWVHRHRGDASMSQQLWTRDELISLRDRVVAWALEEGV